VIGAAPGTAAAARSSPSVATYQCIIIIGHIIVVQFCAVASDRRRLDVSKLNAFNRPRGRFHLGAKRANGGHIMV
jgi:hypothetical protein